MPASATQEAESGATRGTICASCRGPASVNFEEETVTVQKTDLGSTARWTAAVRARESGRTDRLYDDPWAEALAGEEGAAWLADRSEDSTIPMVLRTRFFDDFLVRGSHRARQIVLLAAGLDTRAYRLDWPSGAVVFEIDQPAVLARKEDVLDASGVAPACTRVAVPGDLTASWAEPLLDAGFVSGEPSVWLLEGLTFYLTNADNARLLDGVSQLAAPSSLLGLDVVNGEMLTSRWTRAWVEMQARNGAPWIGTYDDPAGFLAARGWTARLTQGGADDANHGRWPLPVLPIDAPDLPHNWFVTAEKIR
jgi:methyltransferase (TIGR00027 family)